jgi:hypothetical protein
MSLRQIFLVQLLISFMPILPIAIYLVEVLCGVQYLKPTIVIIERLVLGVVGWLILLRLFGESKKTQT